MGELVFARSVTFFVTTGLVLAAVVPAQAAFPGSNGRIAYTYKDFETDTTSVCSVNRDGTGDTCLVNGLAEDPAWLSSGARLAFAFDGDIATMNHDGTGVARVATTDPDVEFEPTVAPSGLQLAFTVDAGGVQQIYRIDSDGTDLTPLTSAASDSGDPAWSPDGSKIAFSRGGDLFTMNPDGTAEANLTNTPGAAEYGPNWSPDGSKLAFAADGGIWRMNATGSARTRLADGTDPVWSPDGLRIAFTRIDEVALTSSLRTINASGAGGDDVAVRTGSIFSAEFAAPDWQPTFLYVRPAGATPLRVSLVPASNKCTAPNREHGPPLAYPSCGPPDPGSPNLTVGVGDGSPAFSRSIGFVRFVVDRGDVAADNEDVRIRFSLSNVMRTSDLSEYTGELRASVQVRLTDRDALVPQTTQDFPLELDVPCVPTEPAVDKSLCELTTTLETLIPGALVEFRRAIWAMDRVKVYDGGPDEDADTTGDNSLFAVQGVFVP
jgi:WD40-like Beta Propeller Repeat